MRHRQTTKTAIRNVREERSQAFLRKALEGPVPGKKVPTLFFRSALIAVTAYLLLCGNCESFGQQLTQSDSPTFGTDVLPMLRSNCIACHNAKLAEGGLNLESVAKILAGGDSGEAVSVADPHGSLLLVRARGEGDSIMPPEDNAVGAKVLTATELSLLEQWIAAGAKDDLISAGRTDASKSQWQPLPENLRSVYALEASPTESVVAVGRGNSIAIVGTATGAIQAELWDSDLKRNYGIPAAHLDFVNALAFSPNGNHLVSGGYRTLKIWRREDSPQPLGKVESLVKALLTQSSGDQNAEISAEQRQQVIDWFKASEHLAGKSADELELARWREDQRRITEQGEYLKGLIAPATERVSKEEEAKKKADENHAKKSEELNEKKKKVEEAQTKIESLKTAEPPATDEQKMAADKELQTAIGAVDTGEKELAAAAQAAASAQDVHQRAIDSLNELNAEVHSNSDVIEQLRLDIERRSMEVAQKTVLTIGYSADKAKAAAVISDGTIALFDAGNGHLFRRLSGASTTVQRLLLIDRWLIASGPPEVAEGSGRDAQDSLAVWNLDGEWELERVIGSPDGQSPFVDRITALEFSPDGKWLVVGGGEPSRTGAVTVLDTNDYSIRSVWDETHSDIVLSVSVSPDGRKLATAGADKQIRIVDFPTGEHVRSLEGHTHHVLGVAWQDHGRRLASVSADHTIKIWNVRAGEAERTINGGGKELSGIAFVAATAQIAVSSGEGTVRLYNADNGGQVRAYNQVQGFQQSIASDPTGKWIAAGSTDGGLRVWPIDAVEPRVVIQ